MSSQNIEIDLLPRKSKFPFRVSSIYYCWRWVRPVNLPVSVKNGYVEISIRLACKVDRCMDEVAGIPCNVTYPHVLIKRPGIAVESKQSEPRDTIAFHYPLQVAEELIKTGMLPEHDVQEFKMTTAIDNLIKDFHRYLYNIYAPGAADEIDWICFKLLRELFQQQPCSTADEKTTIQNASVWMQVHFNEKFSIDELAAQYNMSRASFYRAWNRYFDVTPIQYLLQLKLNAATQLLRETPLSIAQIADDIGFGGVDAFYRKFKSIYQMTPAEYRKKNNRTLEEQLTKPVQEPDDL